MVVKTDSSDDLSMGTSGPVGNVPGGTVLSVSGEGECVWSVCVNMAGEGGWVWSWLERVSVYGNMVVWRVQPSTKIQEGLVTLLTYFLWLCESAKMNQPSQPLESPDCSVSLACTSCMFKPGSSAGLKKVSRYAKSTIDSTSCVH